jgi:hypothetical protein
MLINLLSHVAILRFSFVQKSFFLLYHFLYVSQALLQHAGVLADVLSQLPALLYFRFQLLDLLFEELLLLKLNL